MSDAILAIEAEAREGLDVERLARILRVAFAGVVEPRDEDEILELAAAIAAAYGGGEGME